MKQDKWDSDRNILYLKDLDSVEGNDIGEHGARNTTYRVVQAFKPRNKRTKILFIVSGIVICVLIVALIFTLLSLRSKGTDNKFEGIPNDIVTPSSIIITTSSNPHSTGRWKYDILTTPVPPIPSSTERISIIDEQNKGSENELDVTSTSVPSTSTTTTTTKSVLSTSTSTTTTTTESVLSTSTTTGASLPTDQEISNDTSDVSVRLIVSGQKGYSILDPKKSNITHVLYPAFEDHIFEIYWDSAHFWFKPEGSVIYYTLLQSSLEDVGRKRYRTLFNETRVKIQDIAYDHIGKNLYVIDKSAGMLIVIDVRTRNYNILLTDLIEPHRLELHPEQGLVFILQKSHSVMKGNMDGSNMTNIIENALLTAMTVDRSTQRIYWSNEMGLLSSSDYEGNSEKKFFVGTDDLIDLAVMNGQLFFSINSMNTYGSDRNLLMCDTKIARCSQRSVHRVNQIGNVSSIRVEYPITKNDVNPCDNSVCQQLCLLTPDKGHTCACKLGWQLNTDQKTCHEIEDFMLYTLGTNFRGRILDVDRNTFVDVIWPTPYHVENKNEQLSFEYDQSNDNVYFEDNKNIYTMKLKSNWKNQSIILRGDGKTVIMDLTYDWLTNNLYYIQNNDPDDYKIHVFNVKLGSSYNKTLIDGKHQIDSGLMEHDNIEAHSLVMAPSTGDLFYFTGNEFVHNIIHRVTANGTKISDIDEKAYDMFARYKRIAVDQQDRKIYWISDEFYHDVEYTDFSGENRGSLRVTVPDKLEGISIHGEWMYVSTSYSIWRANKLTGEGLKRIAPITADNDERPVYGVRIVSKSITELQKGREHPCANRDNGGCDQFCFLQDSKAICECRDGEVIYSDGHCHRKESDAGTFEASSLTDLKNSNNTTEGSERLIVSGQKGYSILDPKKYNITHVLYPDFKDHIFEIYWDSAHFWFKPEGSIIYYTLLQSSLEDVGRKRYRTLFNETRVKIQDTAYDHMAENLYVIDKSAGMLIVIDVRTKNHNILLSDLIRPHHLEVHPQLGFVFILQKTHSILRADMDGKNVVTIAQNKYLSAMTIDRSAQKIYWMHGSNELLSSDYMGGSLKKISSLIEDVVDLAVSNNQFFWTQEDHEDDSGSMKYLETCKIINDTCVNFLAHGIEHIGSVGTIKIEYPILENSFIDNPCKLRNGDCQHLCLLKPNKGHSCVCKLGWQLNADQKTCQKVEEFMLYTLGEYFRGRVLDIDTNTSVDVIWPTPYEEKFSSRISFEYDQKKDDLYFSDSKNIYTMKLRSNWSDRSIILHGGKNILIKDIAYDWVTGNLYYIETNPSATIYKIRVINVAMGSKHNKTVKEYDFDPELFDYDENSIVVHSLEIYPSRGQLFYFSDVFPRIDTIHKMSANGTKLSDMEVQAHYTYGIFKQLALDLTDQKIYWTFDEYTGHIKYIDFNGTTKGDVKLNITDEIQYIYVHDKWIYLSTHFSIWRADKLNGNNLIRIAPPLEYDPYHRVYGVKIISDTIKKSLDDPGYVHPCDNKENGGCEEFCFLHESRAVCGCGDDENVDSHGKCYKKSPEEMTTTTHKPFGHLEW